MALEILVPKLNANDDEYEIVFWYVETGGLIKKGDDIVDISSSKAVVTLKSEHSGYLAQHISKGEKGKVGQPIALVFEKKEDLENFKTRQSSVTPKPMPEDRLTGKSRFSNPAEEYIREKQIDRNSLSGMGLVTRRQLEKMFSTDPDRTQRRCEFQHALRSRKINIAKQIEIRFLTQGQMGNINSSITVEFSAAPLYETLKGLNALNGQLLPLIIYEFSKLLNEYPDFNAYFERDEVFYYDSIDVGFAVDTGKGLRVPVLKNTSSLMPHAIYEKIIEMTLKYERNELTDEDLTNGTVTLTDLSGARVRYFQPLLNARQSVILGIGGDNREPNCPTTLTLVFDHRILTGREVAVFLNKLKDALLSYHIEKSLIQSEVLK